LERSNMAFLVQVAISGITQRSWGETEVQIVTDCGL
jgi:hypothetical protein